MPEKSKFKWIEGDEDDTATHIKNPKTGRMCKKDGVLGKGLVLEQTLRAHLNLMKDCTLERIQNLKNVSEKLKKTELELKRAKTSEAFERKEKNEYMLRACETEQDLMVYKRDCKPGCSGGGTAAGDAAQFLAGIEQVVYIAKASKKMPKPEQVAEDFLHDANAEAESSRPRRRLKHSGLTNEFASINIGPYAPVKKEGDHGD